MWLGVCNAGHVGRILKGLGGLSLGSRFHQGLGFRDQGLGLGVRRWSVEFRVNFGLTYWFLVGKKGNIGYGDYVGIISLYSLLRTSKFRGYCPQG